MAPTDMNIAAPSPPIGARLFASWTFCTGYNLVMISVLDTFFLKCLRPALPI